MRSGVRARLRVHRNEATAHAVRIQTYTEIQFKFNDAVVHLILNCVVVIPHSACRSHRSCLSSIRRYPLRDNIITYH